MVYQANFDERRIYFVDIATRAVTFRSFGASINTLWDFAYNEANDYIYYLCENGGGASVNANDQLRRQKADGTLDEILISSFLNSPYRIALDEGNNRAFVTDSYYAAAKIVSVNLSNNTYTTIYNANQVQGGEVIQQLAVPDPPSVSTTAASSITATSATLAGNLLLGYGFNTERGVVYSSTNQTPTVSDTKSIMATNTSNGTYSGNVTGLSPSTTYYARAYVVNGAGTAYGSVITFSTPSNNANLSAYSVSSGTLSPTFATGTTGYTVSLPNSVSTLSVTPTKSHASAAIKVNGTAVNSGSASGSISLNAGPNTINTVVTAQDGTTTVTYALTATRRTDPTISTSAVTGITTTGSTLSGNVSADGYGAITNKGIAIATHSSPTTSDRNLSAGTTGTGTVSFNLTDLTPATTYYLRAYATNIDGTFYGNEITFKTPNALDKIGLTAATVPATAYSLRLLSSTYTGKAINVRREDNNATADIGFTSDGMLDTAALKTFVGTSSAFVAKWYDQSGNGYDLNQSLWAKQPRIVNTGRVDRLNGRPSIYFGHPNYLATVKAVIFPTATSIVGFAKGNSSTPSAFMAKTGTAAGSNNHYPAPFDITNSGGEFYTGNASNTNGSSINAANNNPRFDISNNVAASIYSFVIPSTGNYQAFRNGNLAATGTIASYQDSGNSLMMGNRSDLGGWGDFWSPEVVTFNSVISTTARQALENSEKDYFSNSDANLTALALSTGTLSPAFAPGTLAYTATVPSATTVIKITPSRTQAGGTITINNVTVAPNVASGDINLAVGNNVITVAVIAQDGSTTKTYTVTVTREQTPQTITFAPLSAKSYSTADFAPGATASSGLAVSYTSANTSVATILNNQIHIVGLGTSVITATQTGDATYLAAPEVTQTLTVTKAAITITATAKTKVYGDSDPALTYTITSGALVGSDAFTGTLERNPGITVGNYPITIGTLALNANYDLTFVTNNLTITKRPLILAPVAATKVYGNTDPGFPYNMNGTSYASTDAMTGLFSRPQGENVGTYALGIGNKRPVNTTTFEDMSANYDITFVSSNLTITKRPYTIQPISKTKVYGDPDEYFIQFSSNGTTLAPNEGTTGGFSRLEGENVGQYATTIGAKRIVNIYTGEPSSDNYNITFIPSTYTITPKPITVTANPAAKNYSSADPVFTYTVQSGITDATFTGSLTRTAGEEPGKYAISKGSLAVNSNYTFDFIADSLTIGRQTLVVIPAATTKVYGETDPEYTFTTNVPIVGNSTFTGTLTRQEGNNVGTYPVNGLGTLALDNPRYSLSLGEGGGLTITKRPYTIQPISKTKVYGTADEYFIQFSSNGTRLAPGDGTTGGFSRIEGETVGQYATTIGAKRILDINTGETRSDNYDITFIPSIYTITAKPVTVTANASSKAYGDADPELTYTNSGLAFEDTFSGKLGRIAGENLGTYAINQGTLALGNNYTISFIGADLTIGKKTINVVANAQAKTYGQSDPVLTYTADALATGESFTGTLSRTAGENVGDHAIAQGTLALSANYALNFTGANLSINKATLTYVATPTTRPLKTANPSFTGSVTGFLNSETIATATTGSLLFSTSATLNSPIGLYPINGGGLDAANYNFIQDAGNSTALSITASEDNSISALSSSAALTPTFSPATLNYSAAVANSITSFDLSATISEFATATLNGVAYTSGSTKTLSLVAGSNEFNIVVTAQNQTTKTYRVTINRALSSNNLLSTMYIDNVTFTPTFDPNVTSYYATIPNGKHFIDVHGVAVDPTAFVPGNHDMPNSKDFPLTIETAVGEYTYSFPVTAQNGAVRNYNITVNRLPPLSSNANLLSLNVSATAGFSKNFNFANDTLAPITVANNITSLNLFLYSAHAGATAKVNGVTVPGLNQEYNLSDLTLAEGYNLLNVVVTAENGQVTKTYPVEITRLPYVNTDLASLTISSGTYSPSFSASTTSYSVTVPYSVAQLTLKPVAATNTASIEVSGAAETVTPSNPSATVNLVAGFPNNIRITVKAADGVSKKTYLLNVTRTAPDATLKSLVLNPNTAQTIIDGPADFNYATIVALDATSIRVKPTATESKATITVNGTAIKSGTQSGAILLTDSSTIINIIVTAQDGITVKTYALTVTRKPASNIATLKGLDLTKQTTKTAVTGSADFNYEATVNYTVDSIQVKPTATDATATIRVNGNIVKSAGFSNIIALDAPVTLINIVVTAQDGTTIKTYAITVNRKPASNIATLKGLDLTKQTAKTAATGSADFNYEATVNYNVDSIQVKPTATDATATIRVNGNIVKSAGFSNMIALDAPATLINIVVTAQDGTTIKTYAITVNRKPASNIATLKGLELTKQTAKTAVTGSADFNYEATVNYNVDSIQVKPTATDATATIRVNGNIVKSAVLSQMIALDAPATLINIVVTAQDGTTIKTYAITVNRKPASTIATLKGLDLINNIQKTNTSGSADFNYAAMVSNGTSSIQLKPTATDATATIRINGTIVKSAVYSQIIALTTTSTLINIVVTAQDGTTVKTYSVTVNKKPATVATEKTNDILLSTEIEDNKPKIDELNVNQAISPNGDGQNDVLIIDGIDNYPSNTLTIVNRSGALVFQTKGYNNSSNNFSGKASNGQVQLPGTYFYRLEYVDGKQTKRKTGYLIIKY